MDTKKLRQKILDLAIHGKLVPQDPNDEPASVLLERIKKEKEQLIKQGKIKAPKKSQTPSDTSHYPKEVPFALPNGWVWTTLGEISNYGNCENVNIEDIPEDAWILELEDLEKDTARILNRITKSERSIKGVRHSFFKKDILFSKLRTYLNKVLVAPEDGFCTTEIIPISYNRFIYPEYLNHVLRSNLFLNYTIQCGYGVKMPRLSTSDACKGLIPLPPYNEQKRIANIIDKIFQLIDKLISNEHELKERIQKAKSKILDSAIHGKLVQQDPNDEPAIELLKRINPDFKPSDNLHYEECPSGWVVVQFKSIIDLLSGRDLETTRCNSEGHGLPYLVGASCIEDGCLKFFRWTETPEVISKEEDVLLSCKGTVGEVLHNTVGDIHIARQFMAIRSKAPNYIRPKYLELLIKASIEKLKKAARGIIPGISREDILDLTVMIPPYEEQKRILSKIAEFNQLVSLIAYNIGD